MSWAQLYNNAYWTIFIRTKSSEVHPDFTIRDVWYTASMRICIVEDEHAIAAPLKRSLEKEGFAVDIAEDGNTGLRLIQVNAYDCILPVANTIQLVPEQ